jgi:hypothetical protein
MSGVVQCFSVKKGEVVVSFKSLPGPQKVRSSSRLQVLGTVRAADMPSLHLGACAAQTHPTRQFVGCNPAAGGDYAVLHKSRSHSGVFQMLAACCSCARWSHPAHVHEVTTCPCLSALLLLPGCVAGDSYGAGRLCQAARQDICRSRQHSKHLTCTSASYVGLIHAGHVQC